MHLHVCLLNTVNDTVFRYGVQVVSFNQVIIEIFSIILILYYDYNIMKFIKVASSLEVRKTSDFYTKIRIWQNKISRCISLIRLEVILDNRLKCRRSMSF